MKKPDWKLIWLIIETGFAIPIIIILDLCFEFGIWIWEKLKRT